MDKRVITPSTGSKKPRLFYGYIIVGAAFFIVLVIFGATYTFGVFLKPLIAEFGSTRAETSGAYAMFFFMQGLFYMLGGRLSDRFGPRLVVTIGGLLLGLGYSLMSQISAIWQLYLFYGAIVGIGMGFGFIPLPSTIARWFVHRRSVMTGIVLSGVGVGTVIMPPVATQLISNYGWRTSYLIIGIIALVLIVVVAQFLRRDPRQTGCLPYGVSKAKEESLALAAKGISIGEAIHTKQFWMLCAIFFVFGLAQQVIFVHIVPHATDLRISALAAANILSVSGGLIIAGTIGVGSVADRIGNKLGMVIGFVALVIAFLLPRVAEGLWMLNLSAAIFGFAYGGLLALQAPIVAELFGLKAHGMLLGTVAFALMIGGAIGAFLGGRIFDVTGSYYLAFVICAAVSVIGLILTSLLRPTGWKNLAGNK